MAELLPSKHREPNEDEQPCNCGVCLLFPLFYPSPFFFNRELSFSSTDQETLEPAFNPDSQTTVAPGGVEDLSSRVTIFQTTINAETILTSRS